MTKTAWKPIINMNDSLPAMGEIVGLCISGIPEFVAYKRIPAGTREITYEQVSDPEYVDILSIEEPLERLNDFAVEHGWVWAEQETGMLMMDFNPSHWTLWFDTPSAELPTPSLEKSARDDAKGYGIPRKDDLAFHTRAVFEQFTRYGGAVYSEDLLDLLEVISVINDDLHNCRDQSCIVESVNTAKEILDLIASKKWDDY